MRLNVEKATVSISFRSIILNRGASLRLLIPISFHFRHYVGHLLHHSLFNDNPITKPFHFWDAPLVVSASFLKIHIFSMWFDELSKNNYVNLIMFAFMI